MNRFLLPFVACGWMLAGLSLTFSQPSDPPADSPPPAPPAQEDSAPPDTAPPNAEPAEAAPPAESGPGPDQAMPAPAAEPAPDTGRAAVERPSSRDERPSTSRPVTPAAEGTDTDRVRTKEAGDAGLRMNFRNAPLDLVLNYLSEAAGFIIVLETEVRGKVDVWSNQPVSKDEAVDLLNTVLRKNGYAVLRNGRALTIISRDNAKTRDIPVKSGSDPTAIPRSDEIVTQIIPVRFISAVPLARDLQSLLPSEATLTANEGGNALVMTDSQVNIRRMAEIIKALDTAIASVSSVKVFPLQYADAKALATAIKELFAQDTTRTGQNQGGPGGRFQNFFRGPGGPGGGNGQTDTTGGRAPTTKVNAVADERSNSVVVSAPEDQMGIIEELIAKIDTNVEDITELRVFRLQYADPQETADLLTSLFPDTTTGQSGRGGGPFGGFRFGPGGANASTTASTRLQKQSKVLAVADARTGSVVVSAAHELMTQIAKMIEQLDSDPAKKQKVFVYSVENTDPSTVEELLRTLFEGQNSRNRSTSRNNSQQQMGGQLGNRATTTQNQSSRNSGNSSFGSNIGSQNR